MDDSQVTRFTTLWTSTQSSVLAFISATITNFADSEDILQRVASVAVSKFDQFQSDGDSTAFTVWAIQIARFEVLSYLRSKSKDRCSYLADSVNAIADAYEELSPGFDDRRHALAECLKKVKGRSREILEKRYGEGVKTGKIAAAIGISPGNVSIILNRTYKQLHRCISSKIALGKSQ